MILFEKAAHLASDARQGMSANFRGYETWGLWVLGEFCSKG